MKPYWEIKCPDCETILIVDRISGELIETRKPIADKSSADRFEESLNKVKQGTKEAEKIFQESVNAQKNKAQDLDNLFKKSLEQVKQEGDLGPEKNILDRE